MSHQSCQCLYICSDTCRCHNHSFWRTPVAPLLRKRPSLNKITFKICVYLLRVKLWKHCNMLIPSVVHAWKKPLDFRPGNGSVELYCRSNDSTDAPSGTQCILGYPSNPHQQRLWGGPIHLRPQCAQCVCPEPALMIGGKLTWAIVILMELHGEAYHFTAGEQVWDAGWADAQTERREITPLNFTCIFPPFRKNMSSRGRIWGRNFGIWHHRVFVFSDLIMELAVHIWE